MNYLARKYLYDKLMSDRKKLISVLGIILSVLVSIPILKDYLIFDFNIYLGMLLIPFIMRIKNPGVFSYRYVYPAISFLFLYFIMPVKTIYYFAFCSVILLFIENIFGKTSYSILILLGLMGSITKYFINIFSFSLRLKLSSAAGSMLNFFGFENSVSGNVINIGENSFAVDNECIGLKMVITAFLVMLLFVSFFEKRNRINFNLYGIFILVIITSVLVVFNNFMRITALILFKSLPGSMSHELIGIFSLLVYNIIPLYILTPILLEFFKKRRKRTIFASEKKDKIFPLTSLSIIILMIIHNISYKSTDSKFITTKEIDNIKGYKAEIANNNILKLYSDNSLIYIKPPAKFYGSDHNPYICWRGSGYEFKEVKKTILSGKEIYTAKLVSEGDELYTAWWFQSKENITVSQWDWRLNTIKNNEKYKLINVTSDNADILKTEASKMFGNI